MHAAAQAEPDRLVERDGARVRLVGVQIGPVAARLNPSGNDARQPCREPLVLSRGVAAHAGDLDSTWLLEPLARHRDAALALASECGQPVSTMHGTPWRTPPVCDDEARASASLAAGELRLNLPSAVPALLPRVPDAGARSAFVSAVATWTPRKTSGADGRVLIR